MQESTLKFNEMICPNLGEDLEPNILNNRYE